MHTTRRFLIFTLAVLAIQCFPLHANAGGSRVEKVYTLAPNQEVPVTVTCKNAKQVGFKNIHSLKKGSEVPQEDFAIKLSREHDKGEKGTFALMSSTGAFFPKIQPRSGKINLTLKNLTDIQLETTVFVDKPY